jgi:hypothetical protein
MVRGRGRWWFGVEMVDCGLWKRGGIYDVDEFMILNNDRRA